MRLSDWSCHFDIDIAFVVPILLLNFLPYSVLKSTTYLILLFQVSGHQTQLSPLTLSCQDEQALHLSDQQLCGRGEGSLHL